MDINLTSSIESLSVNVETKTITIVAKPKSDLEAILIGVTLKKTAYVRYLDDKEKIEV